MQKADAVSTYDINLIRQRCAEKEDEWGMFLAEVSLIMHEAQLRYSDIASLLMGDLVWEEGSHITLLIS